MEQLTFIPTLTELLYSQNPYLDSLLGLNSRQVEPKLGQVIFIKELGIMDNTTKLIKSKRTILLFQHKLSTKINRSLTYTRFNLLHFLTDTLLTIQLAKRKTIQFLCMLQECKIKTSCRNDTCQFETCKMNRVLGVIL